MLLCGRIVLCARSLMWSFPEFWRARTTPMRLPLLVNSLRWTLSFPNFHLVPGALGEFDGVFWSQLSSFTNGSPNHLSQGVFPLLGGLEHFADSNSIPWNPPTIHCTDLIATITADVPSFILRKAQSAIPFVSDRWGVEVRWICCLSCASRQSWNNVHHSCGCYLWCCWSLFSEYCVRSRIVFYSITHSFNDMCPSVRQNEL